MKTEWEIANEAWGKYKEGWGDDWEYFAEHWKTDKIKMKLKKLYNKTLFCL